jgi:GntR family transcriptional regulator
MILNIDNHSGVPVYRQLFSQISEMILTGELAAGERMMSVRELAAAIKANPMTVSKAYSMLEREGLLDRKRGIGLYVRSDCKAGSEDDMRLRIIQDAMKTAVKTAVRLGLNEKDAIIVFKQAFNKFGDKKDE